MKIVLWIGNEPNQKALANKIHRIFPLAGIILETRHHSPKLNPVYIFEKVFEKFFLPSIGKSWRDMKKHYEKLFPVYPDVKQLNVSDINSAKAFEFTQDIEPDLILVSGTRLVKEKMLSLQPKVGILNLHTGLSPYIKGGPNCTNWCIATKQFHLIGNTIMWIDSGIDSGNILTTEFTELSGNENLYQLHLKVMEHAHALYIKALNLLIDNKSKSIPQNTIAKGKTYYTRQWTLKHKINLIYNFDKMKAYVESGQLNNDRAKIKTINLK